MLKNYCAACKYEFKNKDQLLLHIQSSHQTGSKTSNPPPVSNRLMDEAYKMYRSLQMGQPSRDIHGVHKDRDTGLLSISDHEVFMRLDGIVKERVHGAIEISKRKFAK